MAGYKTVALTATVLLAMVMVVLPHNIDVPVDTLQVAVVPEDSIQDAINRAQAGAVILIQNGSYFEESYPIVVSKSVTLVGENADATIIDGNGTVQSIFLVRSDGVRIKSLTVRNTVKNSFDVAAVHLANVDNVEVTGCRLSECTVGIMVKNVSNCVIARNKIMNNSVDGILMRDNCVSNLILGNTIADNTNGIRTADFTCRNSRFCHNNFLDNTYQTRLIGVGGVWDGGYPSGGNYWSDYAGVDEKSGSNQDQFGSDGIGDSAYGDGLDRYPSMGPLWFFDAGRWEEHDYYVIVASNTTISSFGFDPSFGPFIKFNATVLSGRMGYWRVLVPRRLLWVESYEQWRVTTSEEIVNPLIIHDVEGDNTCFYWMHDDGAQMIKIDGTHAIPELAVFGFLVVMAIFSALIFLVSNMRRDIRLNSK